ncbi:MAG: HD domain-containing protein, partial [Eubacteriaceae bacterium]|nr:HD domain-containing protein [Eubacteriaceae bacterium]
EIGYRLLSATSEFYAIADAVLAHHERWDGTGYPNGVKGEAINWKARALAIADAYDAMVSERPYKASLSKEEAIAEIKKNAGAQFDPDIARVFVEKVLGVGW